MYKTALLFFALTVSSGVAAGIPFVGCKSDGQTGPLEAPKEHPVTISVTDSIGNQLAYYEAANGPHVFGPRGWYCFGTYGSNGESLYVSPEPIDSANLLSSDWKGFSGSAIQVSISIGETSGRFEVAQTIARVFPAYRRAADKLMEDMPQAAPLPKGSYPSDRLTYKTKRVVEFVTAAEKNGLGTDSHLQQNSSPIFGMAALLGATPDCTVLSLRLPVELSALRSIILAQAEREALQQR